MLPALDNGCPQNCGSSCCCLDDKRTLEDEVALAARDRVILYYALPAPNNS